MTKAHYVGLGRGLICTVIYLAGGPGRA